VLFVHIPKTGGSSVEKWMSGSGDLCFHTSGIPSCCKCTPQHFTLRAIKTLLPGMHFDYAFTIVRNPYERLESEYRQQWLLRKGGFFKGFPSFSSWIEPSLERAAANPLAADSHLRPQVDFIGSGLNVFRFEEGISAVITQVAAAIGSSAPLEQIHELRTGGDAPPIEWRLEDLILANRFYSQDFSQFGYEMRPTQ